MIVSPRCFLLPASALALTLLPAQEVRIVGRSDPLSGAFDAARGRLVTIGKAGETSEWDGTRWYQRPIERLPPYQADQKMAYDGARGRLILTGGDWATPFTTWAFDDVSWQTITTSNAPSQRRDYVLVSDAARGELVLFGGSTYAYQLLGDTWIFDGQDWSQASPATAPSARQSSAACHDRSRGRVVLFGGDLGTATAGDTWEWDGVGWTLVQVAASPPPRRGAAMAFDPLRGRTVMFSGFDGLYLSDVWEFDGTAWLAATPATPGPQARFGAVMAFDDGLGECVSFGGTNNGAVAFDTWSWDGARWMQHSMHEPSRGVLAEDIAVGAPSGDGLFLFRTRLDETWTWTRTGWVEHQVPPPTPSRLFASGCGALGAAYLYGGLSASTPNTLLSDLWQWNGATWTQLAAQGPILADWTSMVFDHSRQELVLVGLSNPTSTVVETWVWNGSAWQVRTPTNSPTARVWAPMAYDLARSRVVLHGGRLVGTSTQLSDTWEWDGVDWTAVATPGPAPAGSGGLAFDLSRGRIVKVEGYGPLSVAHVWSYDGVAWARLNIAGAAADLMPGGVVGWPTLDGLMANGRDALVDLSGDQAAVRQYGTGCTAQAPVITANEWPRRDSPAFAIEVAAAPANSLVALLGATVAAALPIGVCTQLVQPGQALVLLPTSAGGVARANVPLPASPTFRGVDLFFQAAALDPAAANGFTMTRGLQVSIGF